MNRSHAYSKVINKLPWDSQKDVPSKIIIDYRIKYLFKEECKIEGISMNDQINNLISAWVVRKMRSHGQRIRLGDKEYIL